MKIEKMLVIVIALQCLILLGQWTSHQSGTPANAEIFNPSERQLAILEEAKNTNGKLDKLITFLQSGEMTVKIAKEDEAKK